LDKLSQFPIADSISKTLLDTFDSMMSLQLTQVDSVTDSGLNDNRIVGAVKFAGEVIGMLSIHVSRPFSRIMAAAMLGIEPDEITDEDEINDVIGEVCNIVSGNLKTDFVNSDLNCVISTPSITKGREFTIEPLDIAPPQNIVFRHEPHDILIEWAVKEDTSVKDTVTANKPLTPEEIREKIGRVDVNAAIVNSVIDVFYTMLSMEVERIMELPEDSIEKKRIVGSVSFVGDVDGIFNIQLSDAFSRTMTAAMLGIEIDEIENDDEIYDVIKEVSNIVGGNLKSTFGDAGLTCVLSTPSITYGTDFSVEPLNSIAANRFYFKYQNHFIIIEAGVKKEKESAVADSEDPQDAVSRMFAEAVQANTGSQEAPYVQATSGSSPPTTGFLDEAQIKNLNLILDIPMEVTVVLGKTRQRIDELLKIKEGSVIEFSQLAGEPVDIMIRDTLIARGEVVVQSEKYGIRIIEIVSRKKRLLSMG
jgi:flagellar motor switch protein FliN